MRKIKKPYAKCIALAKLIAKARDDYTSIKSGQKDRTVGGNKQIHASHILGTGSHPKLATYPVNIKCLTATEHMLWHSSPTESGWFREKYPNWYRQVDELRIELEENERGTIVIDYQKRYWKLKDVLDKLNI